MLDLIGLMFIMAVGAFGGFQIGRLTYKDRTALKETYHDEFSFGVRSYWKEFSFDRLAKLETVIGQLRENLADATKKRAQWQARAQSLVGTPQAPKNSKKK